jgi:transposase-like protein
MSDTTTAGDPMHDHARKCTIAADDLSDKQRAAIELLILGQRMSCIAGAVGIDPSTLYRWRQDEAFRTELDRCRRELWSGAAERLRALVHPSLDVMEQHLRDRYDRNRFRAASSVLRLADLRKCVPLDEEDAAAHEPV